MAAKYPTALATDADLLVAKNRAQTTLVGNLNASDTTFTLASDAFAANVAITIGSEIILILTKSGATVTNSTRGYDSTTAASHLSGVAVTAYIDAIHHNQVSQEIQAIETALGTNLGNIPVVSYPIAVNKGGTAAITAAAARASLSAAVLGANNDITSLSALSTPLSVAQGGTGAATLTGILEGHGTSAATANAAGSELQYLRRKPNNGATAAYEFAAMVDLHSADYNFTAVTPTGSPNLSIGSNTITLPIIPQGVNGTNTNYYVYISGGTGTAEAVLVTGGTATSGSTAQTLIVTCANTHSGAYTVTSATAGISEAIWALTSAVGGRISLPAGTLTIHAPIKRRLLTPISVRGQGMQATTLAIASDFSTSANGVFDWSPGDTNAVPVGGASDLTISFTQPDSTNLATYTHWPPAVYTTGTYQSQWRNLTLIAAWDGFKMPGNTNGLYVENIYASFFHRLFDLDGHSFDSVRLENIHSTTIGLTANQGTCYLASGTANVGFYIGSIDDLKINNATIGTAHVADFHVGSDGFYASGFITNLWAEGNITVSDGVLHFTGLHFSSSATGVSFLNHTGGQVFIEGADISYGGTVPVILSSVSHGYSTAPYYPVPVLSVRNSLIDSAAGDVRSISATCSGGYAGLSQVIVQNNVFSRTAGTTVYAQQTVIALAGSGDTVLTATGNRFTGALSGGGSGIAFQVDTNTTHLIGNNVGDTGWNYSLPASLTSMVWFGNSKFDGNVNYLHDATKITARFTATTFAPLQTENYIASETGANNAIAGALLDAAGTAVPIGAGGLKVTIKLAHTLQAGANTFNLNAVGAVNIKSSRNVANNIGTAYAATGTITLLYDGTEWVDVSQ